MKKIVYHGSSNKNLRMKPNTLLWFTDNRDEAEDWANRLILGGKRNKGSYVYKAEITFNKPYKQGDVNANPEYKKHKDNPQYDEIETEIFMEDTLNFQDFVDKGYDCFTLDTGFSNHYAIPNKSQIKWLDMETISENVKNKQPDNIHEEYNWNKGISNIKESLEKIDNFYLTQNAYDVIRFIKGRKQDTRIVYDSNINYYFFSLALDYTHLQLLEQARKTGLYTIKNMTDYFIENEDSVYFLYYYPTVAEITTSKGFVSEQYPNEYNYNFGTICSYYATNFEEMELYNLLKKDLNEQLAYHGSNVEFDKFDLNKFQRGDYGYGIYLTWNKDYAKDYGNVKQYDIPESNELLHWEDPITWQDKSIQEKIAKLIDDIYEMDEDKYDELFENTWNYCNQRGVSCPGSVFYYKLSQLLNLSGKDLAQYLYKYGIKGTESDKGNCYCIFNPQDIKSVIVENEFKTLNEQLEAFLEETSGQQTGKPSASLGDNSNIRRVRPHDSNNIIN